MSKERMHFHHTLWPQRMWRSQEPTTKLREHRWLKVPLDIYTHDALHKNVSMVPVPGHAMAERISRNFMPVPHNYIASHDNLIQAVEEVAAHHKTNSLERQLGGLIVVALVEQRPFLVEGLIVQEEKVY